MNDNEFEVYRNQRRLNHQRNARDRVNEYENKATNELQEKIRIAKKEKEEKLAEFKANKEAKFKQVDECSRKEEDKLRKLREEKFSVANDEMKEEVNEARIQCKRDVKRNMEEKKNVEMNIEKEQDELSKLRFEKYQQEKIETEKTEKLLKEQFRQREAKIEKHSEELSVQKEKINDAQVESSQRLNVHRKQMDEENEIEVQQLQQNHIKLQNSLVEMRLVNFEKTNIEKVNQHIHNLKLACESTRNSFYECLKELLILKQNGSGKFRKAKTDMESLKDDVMEFSKELSLIDKSLTQIADKDVHNTVSGQILKVKKIINGIGTSFCKIIVCLEVNKTNWDEASFEIFQNGMEQIFDGIDDICELNALGGELHNLMTSLKVDDSKNVKCIK